jgi:hypothetical protein
MLTVKSTNRTHWAELAGSRTLVLAAGLDVFWLEQVRPREPMPAFSRARRVDSPEMPLPD